MADESIRDPRILEAIESCRPGSDDLADPSLSWVAARLASDPRLRADSRKIHQADANLAQAFGDVALPEGLAQRIIARLEVQSRAETAPEGPAGELPWGTSAETVAAELPGHQQLPQPQPRPLSRQRVRRRWILAGIGFLAVAGAMLPAIMLINSSQQENLTASVIQERAIDFFDREGDAIQEGTFTRLHAPPGAYPISPEVASLAEIRWRRIHGFLGRRGVAYDLTPPGNPRATLYVVRCKVPGLPNLPPSKPAQNSRKRFTAAWQSGSLVYVLVVEDNPRIYQGVLNLSSGPWT